MNDLLYKAKNVPIDVRPLFEQLRVEFSEYEVWTRYENFGRTLLAAVVNRKRGIAVSIPITRSGYQRIRGFEQIELGRIRSHLQIGSEDLDLP